MAYRLRFAGEAARDLDETFDYIRNTLSAPKAAENLMLEIENAISGLKENPYLYAPCRDPVLAEMSYRSLVVKNYIVVYSVNDDAHVVNILRIFYGKMDYGKLM